MVRPFHPAQFASHTLYQRLVPHRSYPNRKPRSSDRIYRKRIAIRTGAISPDPSVAPSSTARFDLKLSELRSDFASNSSSANYITTTPQCPILEPKI
ncbi:uncharacterized protein N7529_006859 [Penicillium soppii]|uniref:uncharacterized protein n=1 Tax=Penicillium soppii TaxID=69789 RepID=UPI002548601B|nr:uncharacterized protein N7529_006859 [Penicillium soppii]KAJ5864943.1 hypothetical protein N7529_006859 [Penicillium soppii]